MKHITVIQAENTYVAVTVTSNNFGDQILELKQLIIVDDKGSYDIICTDSFPEGNHLSVTDIKEWAWINLQ